MINKQSIWFLTLFALVLVLGIYYITMPSGIVNTLSDVELDNTKTVLYENNVLSSLRVERDEETLSMMEELESKITDINATSEEKNEAFEELKILNLVKGKETTLEEKIFSNYNVKSFVKISGSDIEVTIDSKEHDTKLANDIMRCVQEEYEEKVNIIVKFN